MRYAKIENGQIVSERTSKTAISIDQIRHVNGEPMLRPIIETTIDNSTGPNTVSVTADTIFPDRVERVRAIRDMTAQEITTRDQQQADNAYSPQVKALALILLDEINLLRAKAGLASRTPAQLKTAFDAKFKQVK